MPGGTGASERDEHPAGGWLRPCVTVRERSGCSGWFWSCWSSRESGRRARSPRDRPLTLADDFQSGPGAVWRLQRVLADALKSVPDPAGQDRNVLQITLRTGDMAESGGVAERAELVRGQPPPPPDRHRRLVQLPAVRPDRLSGGRPAPRPRAVEAGLRRLRGRPQPGHRQPLPERGLLDHHPRGRQARRALRGEGRHPRALEPARLPPQADAHARRLPSGVAQRPPGRRPQGLRWGTRTISTASTSRSVSIATPSPSR